MMKKKKKKSHRNHRLFQVDLLLGTWAEQNVPSLTVEEMDSYEDILNLETVDIFNFIAGNADPPAFVDTPMMKRLQVRYSAVQYQRVFFDVA